jgi:hypothetical protein
MRTRRPHWLDLFTRYCDPIDESLAEFASVAARIATSIEFIQRGQMVRVDIKTL